MSNSDCGFAAYKCGETADAPNLDACDFFGGESNDKCVFDPEEKFHETKRSGTPHVKIAVVF